MIEEDANFSKMLSLLISTTPESLEELEEMLEVISSRDVISTFPSKISKNLKKRASSINIPPAQVSVEEVEESIVKKPKTCASDDICEDKDSWKETVSSNTKASGSLLAREKLFHHLTKNSPSTLTPHTNPSLFCQICTLKENVAKRSLIECQECHLYFHQNPALATSSNSSKQCPLSSISSSLAFSQSPPSFQPFRRNENKLSILSTMESRPLNKANNSSKKSPLLGLAGLAANLNKMPTKKD